MHALKTLVISAALVLTTLTAPLHAADDEEWPVTKVALQVSDNEPGTMDKVLNVAANLSRAMSEQGEEVEIEIVAFNAGLHMLREDTSPVAERIRNFPSSMPNVRFAACGNTIAGMTRKEGAEPPIMEFAHNVQAGVLRLIELQQDGYVILRP